jgi:hypothetical protein
VPLFSAGPFLTLFFFYYTTTTTTTTHRKSTTIIHGTTIEYRISPHLTFKKINFRERKEVPDMPPLPAAPLSLDIFC